ncbi:ribosomal protein S2 [Enteractinococcus coprophilus]|uniref:Small ribosomal subunit protein uS2 n=2 Tax=Enteractinococcus coprophilus TaxID=1027633 RepID=A0A543AF24_9MICC|nr:ribosomal protein S2 [Enteractinococcus coprophilus]
MTVVTMRELLDSGAHFGHQTSRWNPKMKRYILTERNGIYIIDLQQSLSLIDQAYEFVKQTVAHGGNILFVGTKKQAQVPIAEQAMRVGMPYVNHRWLGGMLTNFATVSKRVDRMKELEEIDFDDVAGSGRTKKELLLLERELTKLQSSLGGIRNMSRTPSAIWIVDTEKEHLAVDEAKKLGIPVIAILDTNADPEDVTYPIPGNDDSMRSVAVLTRVIADAIAEGLMSRNQGASGTGSPEEPMAEWERELLESGAATTTTQTSTTGNIDEVTEILRTVQEAYPGGILIEIEQEDDTFEVEIVHEGKLHELEVAKDGTIKIEDVDQDDDDIQNAQKISVPLPDGLTQALTQHPNATIESIELEDKDGVLYWEVELKDEQGNDIEFDVPAAHSDD